MIFNLRFVFSSLITVIVICFCFTIHVQAGEVNHGSIHNHYSFEISDSWVQIPQSVIQETMETLYPKDSIEKVDFEFGFQKDYDGQYFTYPYFIVQPIKGSPLSKSELMDFVDISPEEQQDIADDIKIENLPNEEPIQSSYLENKHAAFKSSVVNVIGIGEVTILETAFSGLEGAVVIHYYSTNDDLTSDLIFFSNIIDSFEFDEGYGYQETYKPSREEKVVTGTLSYVFVLIVFLVIYAGLKKLLKLE